MTLRNAKAQMSRLMVCLTLFVMMGSAVQAATTHLVTAQTLVSNLLISKKNVYGSSPSTILWNGASSEARTVCSTFMSLLLKHTYSYTDSYFSSWFGSTSPCAALYHDTINLQKGFQKITNVTQIQAGDVFAIKYFDGAANTGHVMLAAGAPHLRTATSPLVSGSTQYDIEVIDSSQSYHGKSDTRYTSGQPGGIGKGVFRIYTDANGAIVGYTWSLESNSIFYSPAARDLVAGRLSN